MREEGNVPMEAGIEKNLMQSHEPRREQLSEVWKRNEKHSPLELSAFHCCQPLHLWSFIMATGNKHTAFKRVNNLVG